MPRSRNAPAAGPGPRGGSPTTCRARCNTAPAFRPSSSTCWSPTCCPCAGPVALVQAISGLRLSEATCLGYVRRLHDALGSWEEAAAAHLLERPAPHADETGFRVDGRTQWLHVLTDGALTLKFLHRKRGREAIDEIGIIPRYTGTLVHDCWASYLGYDQCRHQLCGSHLLRELTFIVESNGFRWARLMKKLLREACHSVNGSGTKTLAEAERRAVRKRYRTILTRGARELPEIPPRPKGKRGRIAKTDAHNLYERLVKHEESVLRFMGDPDVSFANNAGVNLSWRRFLVSCCEDLAGWCGVVICWQSVPRAAEPA